MTTIIENTLIGLEEVQFAMWRQLSNGLNTAIEDVATYFEDMDEEVWEMQGNDPLGGWFKHCGGMRQVGSAHGTAVLRSAWQAVQITGATAF